MEPRFAHSRQYMTTVVDSGKDIFCYVVPHEDHARNDCVFFDDATIDSRACHNREKDHRCLKSDGELSQ